MAGNMAQQFSRLKQRFVELDQNRYDITLITPEELSEIRRIWLEDKHE